MAANNSLTIVNVTEKDGAVYSCRATNAFGKVAVRESTVTVLGNYLACLEIDACAWMVLAWFGEIRSKHFSRFWSS